MIAHACPFCGAEPEPVAVVMSRGIFRRIQCRDRLKCMSDGPLAPEPGESDEMKLAAIERWNRPKRVAQAGDGSNG